MNVNLSEILTQCLSSNTQVRTEGENRIDQLAMANFGGLLESCASELADESKPFKTRQLCATLIKNLILHIPKHQGKWEQLPTEIKYNIKSYTLSCLASEVKEVRKAAGLCVAGILLFNSRNM